MEIIKTRFFVMLVNTNIAVPLIMQKNDAAAVA